MNWTIEKVKALKPADIRQLRANAESRGIAEIVSLCDEALRSLAQTRPSRHSGRPRPASDGRPLVSRSKAFELRGVPLRNPRWSWGGIRNDGSIVLTIWAKDIEVEGNRRRYLLYGQSSSGDRLLASTPGGRERLAHCEAALARGEAEGLLVYGERRGQDLPPDEPSRISGADPYTMLRFRVEKDGDKYWAVWDAAAPGHCLCCHVGTPKSGPRVCPECMHVFQGNGWDGIDAHWRARHEMILPYKAFWDSMCSEHRG